MSDSDKLIDFVSKRQKTIETRRRDFERVVFQEFMGTYCVIDELGTGHPLKMVDISYNGCMFQIPWNKGHEGRFKSGQELNLKMYFSKGSYLPIVVTLKHSTEFVDDQGQRCVRIGCEFDQNLPSFQALQSFIAFIYQYAEYSVIDKGEGKVFFF